MIRTISTSMVLVAACAAHAAAQVGYTPSNSPYEDQKIGQRLSIVAGQLFTGDDPALVKPSSAPMFGVRYDIGIGGPTAMYVRYQASPSERRLLIPTRPAATRVDGTPSVTTHVADLGLDISLTGRKSWHRMMPSVIAGIGLASDLRDADAGGYRFGTKFIVSYGFAMRIVTSSRLSYRIDATNFNWQYSYPDSYFVPASDQTSVLSDTRKRNAWTKNWGISGGVSWMLFR